MKTDDKIVCENLIIDQEIIKDIIDEADEDESGDCGIRNEADIEKLKFVHEKICNNAQTVLQKIKSVDEKLNMILVFNAALFVLLTSVFPLQIEDGPIKYAVIIFVCVFSLSEIVTICMILCAMLSRRYRNISLQTYCENDYYNMDIQKIYEHELDGELKGASDLKDILKIKTLFSIVATICTMLNLVFIMVAVLCREFGCAA